MGSCVVGPCRCGGYGTVFNEEAEAEYGVCHLDNPSASVIRFDSPTRIRVEQQPDGRWSATLFDPGKGDLFRAEFIDSDKSVAAGKALAAWRNRATVVAIVVGEEVSDGAE